MDKELKVVGDVGEKLIALSTPEVIRTQCNAIFKFFNALFCEGTDKKIFGDKVNLVTCLKSLDEFVTQVRNQNDK
ncbi:DUF6673 family protein, partial [Clostridium sp. HCS.1]|uniref:DUF6673 family protein n=1 Tax=Clostridium sp. HCS.1 TaxID=3238594 RepID=UPI003A1011BB